jgi:hypothetical protein
MEKETLANRCFKIGEQAGLELIDTLIRKVKKEHPKPNRVEGLSALLAGISSCLLFRGHREIERMLFEEKMEIKTADQWMQATISKVIEALERDKVPVEARFFIGRKK